MSKEKHKLIDPNEFALAVISSIPLKGDSPETIAEEKLNYYLAAYEKALEFNDSYKKNENLLERYKRLNNI
ncbi:hypothetical protein [Rummeliibacillus sp. POC4]|uniref:hypothetical protein n=1 Tax=Rummeliibacillus sp. POC4 TaxID=2305899 RepID=UPI000E6743CF|nr:hypothetical protein [Rummeliibacillus sp. POC4]RIJ64126.1 hypothetical protein D1606_11735 [Rummeliibacillus sp. POC4]